MITFPLLMLALANATIIMTLTKSSLFKKFRDILPNTPIINIKKLFHCPYCLSHYTSFLLLSILLPHTVFLDFIIELLALIALTSIFAYPILRYLKLLETK